MYNAQWERKNKPFPLIIHFIPLPETSSLQRLIYQLRHLYYQDCVHSIFNTILRQIPLWGQ